MRPAVKVEPQRSPVYSPKNKPGSVSRAFIFWKVLQSVVNMASRFHPKVKINFTMEHTLIPIVVLTGKTAGKEWVGKRRSAAHEPEPSFSDGVKFRSHG